MNMSQRLGAAAVFLMALAFAFQNCSPAKLTGNASLQQTESASTVGNKVNLTSLLSSAAESSANNLYPTASITRNASYSVDRPVIENLILKNNDFTRIEWVQASTSTVISNSTILSERNFSTDLSGTVMVFGYRGLTPFFLGQYFFSNRTTSTLGATSVGAVTVNQKAVFSDTLTEAFVIDVNAPDVDVMSIQFSFPASGQVIGNQRAVLVRKNRSEAMKVTVKVVDSLNQTFSQDLNFPASITSQTTTTTTSTTTTLPTSTTTTTTLAPLAITVAPSVSSITSNSAVISWSLNRVAQGQVQYGLTAAYGSLSKLESSFNYSSHSQILSGLTSGVVYHYRVVSTDASGNQVFSPDSTFVTVAVAANDPGWTTCNIENQTCIVPGARTVRYGANNSYKTINLVTGSISCDSATFGGDPAPGYTKYCYYSTAEVVFHVRTRVNNLSQIDASSNVSGIAMQIWSPYVSPTQDFIFTSASELKVQGKCLVATATSSGTPLVDADCTGNSNQKWTYIPSTGEIKSFSGLCVDLGNSSVVNGNSISIFNCHGGLNQKWDFVP